MPIFSFASLTTPVPPLALARRSLLRRRRFLLALGVAELAALSGSAAAACLAFERARGAGQRNAAAVAQRPASSSGRIISSAVRVLLCAAASWLSRRRSVCNAYDSTSALNLTRCRS